MSDHGLATKAAPLNSISERQNEAHFLHLLRARQRIYMEASKLQVAQLLLVVLLPVLGAVAGLIWPDLRPYVASLALVIAVLDTAWLDRWQRGKLKAAAKICEQFDCELMDLPWNRLVAGKRLDPEHIEAAASAWRRGDDTLGNWYPEEIRDAAPPLARVMCQRANAWYDTQLAATLWHLAARHSVRCVHCFLAGWPGAEAIVARPYRHRPNPGSAGPHLVFARALPPTRCR